jgi:hypothetical protein
MRTTQSSHHGSEPPESGIRSVPDSAASPGLGGRRRPVPVLIATLLAAALALIAAEGSGGAQPARVARYAALPVARASSFVSLVPACGCAKRTALDAFSLKTGRRIRRLAWLPPYAPGQQIGTPAAASNGRLLITVTTGARCIAGNYMECPHWIPDSCRSRVEAFTPRTGALNDAFTLAGSEQLGYAVPDPNDTRAALTLSPCISLHGTTGLVMRTLSTARVSPILTTDNPCDGFSAPAWNAAGSRLVFVFDRAHGRPIPIAGGSACPTATNRLAVVSAQRPTRPGHETLIAPDRGCVFEAAAFDAGGIAAAEGCKQGSPPDQADTHIGWAYLLQLDSNNTITRRFRLKLGLEHALIAAVRGTHSVLVTQDQPANEPYPERDWVWQFNGSALRPIAHYAANDAAQVIAVPW